MISFGKRVNSMSGFLDGMVNFVFRYLTEDPAAMDALVDANVDTDVGKKMGSWFKNFFNSEVSSYQRDYTVTTNSE